MIIPLMTGNWAHLAGSQQLPGPQPVPDGKQEGNRKFFIAWNSCTFHAFRISNENCVFDLLVLHIKNSRKDVGMSLWKRPQKDYFAMFF